MSLFNSKNIRKEIISSYEVGKIGIMILPLRVFQRKLLDCLWYAHKYPSRGSRRTPVDIEEAVTKWVNTIAGITLSHTKDELDKWEFTLNDILTPILTAPVSQLREFYKKLLIALEADQRIPFVVWGLFNKWGEHILTKTDDKGVIKLKTKLAQSIAELVEEDVKPQLVEAMTNALQWRQPKQLQKMKKAIEKNIEEGKKDGGVNGGTKAKLTGKESCLFLEAGGEMVML